MQWCVTLTHVLLVAVSRATNRSIVYCLLSINSRATLIDCVAYLLAYGETIKNTACASYLSAAIIRISTVTIILHIIFQLIFTLIMDLILYQMVDGSTTMEIIKCSRWYVLQLTVSLVHSQSLCNI